MGKERLIPGTDPGFLLDGMTISRYTVPGAPETTLEDLNDSGLAVVTASEFVGIRGYVFDLATEVFTLVPPIPGQGEGGIVFASGLDINSRFIGQFEDVDGFRTGVAWDGTTFEFFNFPGAQNTRVLAADDKSTWIAGNWDSGDGVRNGFIYDGSNYYLINIPGAAMTSIGGITVSPPGPEISFAGTYVDSSGDTIGFVAVPEPRFGSLAAAGMAFLYLMGLARR